MNEEQKIRGGGNPELNDEALDAVSGGSDPTLEFGKELSPTASAQKARDWILQMAEAKNNLDQKEQQP